MKKAPLETYKPDNDLPCLLVRKVLFQFNRNPKSNAGLTMLFLTFLILSVFVNGHFSFFYTNKVGVIFFYIQVQVKMFGVLFIYLDR